MGQLPFGNHRAHSWVSGQSLGIVLSKLESVQIILVLRHWRALLASELSDVGPVEDILIHFGWAIAERSLVLDGVVEVLLRLDYA